MHTGLSKAGLVMLMILGVTACRAQDKKQGINNDQPKDKNQPQVSWKVNKTRDKNGNVIGYDSTYTWSYSSKEGNWEQADSMMKAFEKQFSFQFPTTFGGFGMNDSSFFNNLSFPNFFSNKWTQQMQEMHKGMEQRMQMMMRQPHRKQQLAQPEQTKEEESKLPLLTL